MFGAVASDSTAYRVIDSIDAAGLERLRGAVAIARERAWELGAAPKQVVMDFDATLLEAFSRKQGAAGTFKKAFGHHPLLCYLDGSREALAGVLRDGNAGSNTAADHMSVGDLLLLTGDLARAQPATLRYRLWHTAAKLARHARRTHLPADDDAAGRHADRRRNQRRDRARARRRPATGATPTRPPRAPTA